MKTTYQNSNVATETPAELRGSAEALIARKGITGSDAAAIRTCDYEQIAGLTSEDAECARAVGHFANACYAFSVGHLAYARDQLTLTTLA